MSRESGMPGYREADLERIRQRTFVRAVEYHREIESTNTRALRLAEEGSLSLPALVLADLQTAGRGRGGHGWWSAPGALTFSVILPRDALAADRCWPQVSLTAGLAVCDALQQVRPGLEIGLKWPNDVYVRSRKICGILVELSSRAPARLVVGVGLNVNNSAAQAPPALSDSAIALIDVTGYACDLTTVLISILQQLAGQLSTLTSARATLAHRWQELCMLTGRTVQVTAGARTTTGTCRGIDESGALLVDTGWGHEPCTSGTVTVRD